LRNNGIHAELRWDSREARQQIGGLDLKRVGEFADGIEGRALPGALQYADIVSVQVGHFREFLLRNALGEPKLPQALAKELPLLLNAHE